MKKSTFLLFVLVSLVLAAIPGQPARAVGETSTRFGVFVPPNGTYDNRDPALIVTAVQDGTDVDIVDAEGSSDGVSPPGAAPDMKDCGYGQSIDSEQDNRNP